MNQILPTYIPHQILTFMASPRCCQQVSGTLRTPERLALMEHAGKFGIRLQLKSFNGVMTVKLCKRSCMHYLQSPVSLLFSAGVKELFNGLSQLDFFGSTANLYMSNYASNINKPSPKLPQMRYHIGNRTPDNPPLNGNEKMPATDLPINSKLIKAINSNNVVLVSGHLRDLSIIVPHMLLADHIIVNNKCRILVVETQQLLASYNSFRAAALWGESVGQTVGCQYALHSCINSESLIIYTTGDYVLRTLMGKSQATYFSSITHVVVADVQLEKAATHLLFCELRQALKFQTQLKIIMLSQTSNNDIITYFKQGIIFDLETQANVLPPQLADVIYLDEIIMLVEAARSNRIQNRAIQQILHPCAPKYIQRPSLNTDKYLEQYSLTGSTTVLTALLLLVDLECENINYQHSKTGVCAILLAAQHGNAEHIKILLNHNADPFLTDYEGRSAVSLCFNCANWDCIEVFNAHCRAKISKKNYHASYIDFELVADLVKLVMLDWVPGEIRNCNIIIFLSTYEDLLKMEYRLLRNRYLGILPQSLKIDLIHEHTTREQLDELIKSPSATSQIVLSTGIGEILYFLLSFSYVIDSAREYHTKFNEEYGHRDLSFNFISKESLERRRSLVDKIWAKTKLGNVFRLLPRHVYEELPLQQVPELSFMSLEKVCLTVKLLAPHKMIAEYLQETPKIPSFTSVNKAILFLKKIGVLDEMEDVTWLGVRIIDLPVDVQLGKMLIFAIILQCLDPIVTMVSFMATYDPLTLPNDYNVGRRMRNENLHEMRSEFKRLRVQMADDIFSDHYAMLHLFQEWQNNLPTEIVKNEKILEGEQKFLLDGILLFITEVRTNLVASLRAAHLVHASGCFSMANINHKSNCWPLVKAVLVAGLYPHILLVDSVDSHFKSNKSSRILLHPETILRHEKSSPSQMQDIATYKSPWVIYSKCFTGPCANALSGCTVISTMAMVLFSGTEKTYPYHIVHDHDEIGTDTYCHLYLDEWLWFFMKENEAISVLKLRKYMFHIMTSFLKDCDDSVKLRDLHTMRCYNTKLFTAIQNILVHEDDILGFKQPYGVGLRPKAITYSACRYRPIIRVNILENNSKSSSTKIKKLDFEIIKVYYLIYIPDYLDQDSVMAWLHNKMTLSLLPEPNSNENVLTYYFLFSKKKHLFQHVFLNSVNKSGVTELRECFRNDIPLHKLMYICEANKIPCKFDVYEGGYVYKLDQIIGEIIIFIFAYYNHY